MKKIISAILTLTIISATVPVVDAENFIEDTELAIKSDLYIDGSVKDKVSQIAEVEIIELDEPLDVEFEIESSNDIQLFSATEKSFFDCGSDWGYKDLDIRSNPTGRKAFYNELLRINKAFVSDMSDVPSITHGGNEYYVIGQINGAECNNITYSEASETFISFRQDHPEYYWIPYSISAYRENNVYYIEIFKDYAQGSVRSELTSAIQNEFNNYMKVIDGYTTIFEKSLILYDKIIDNVEYGYDEYGEPLDNDHIYAHNIVGVMDGSDNTNPVCESYSKAYQLLLNAVGVENIYVVGDYMFEGHAWNYIKTEDGKWHPTDITHDDGEKHVSHLNFFPEENGYQYREIFGDLAGDDVVLDEYTWGSGGHVPYNAIDEKYFQYTIPSIDKNRYVFKEKPEKLLDLIKYEQLNDGTLKIIDAHNVYGNVEIPDMIDGMKVTSIGDGAFEYTHLAYSYTVPSSVTSLGQRAFAQGADPISSLTSIEFLGAITDCSDSVLYGCSKLTNVKISEGTTIIGPSMFEKCIALEQISLPESVKLIDGCAFQECTALKNLYIGKNVELIWYKAFNQCDSLQSITVSSENNYYTEVDNVLFTKDMKTLVYCINREEYNIPPSVEEFYDGAFSANKALKKITIPEGTTSLPSYMFEGCSSLTDVYIPRSVTYIGSGLFKDCVSLTDIIIPESVDYISYEMFDGCNGLTDVQIPERIKYIYGQAFRYCINLEKVNIEYGVQMIGEDAFVQCRSLKDISIPVSVNYIGNGAFAEDDKIESIILPPNIKKISDFTFNNCQGIKEIAIPDGVTEIGEWAFSNCISLKKVHLPDSITDIKDYAFNICGYLEEINMPKNLKSIGEDAFHGDTSLKEISLPKTLNSIGDRAFISCNSLTGDIVIPDSVAEIGSQTFYYCENITSISLPKGLKTIGNGAFEYCKRLEEIKIPYGTQRIGMDAFSHCWYYGEHGVCKLNKIKIPSTVTEIGEHAFLYDYDKHDNTDITIYGYEGTAAQAYANEDNITFFAIDEHLPIINSSSINKEGNTYIFSVNISDIPIECPMYAALYSNGELVGIKSVILDKEAYTGEVTIEASKNSDTAKIFIWDGLYPLAYQSSAI